MIPALIATTRSGFDVSTCDRKSRWSFGLGDDTPNRGLEILSLRTIAWSERVSDKSQKVRTCRELGGDIFAAVAQLKGQPEYAGLENVDFADQKLLVDVAMRVLASHAGVTIVQDPDLPVQPLDGDLLETKE